MDYDKQEHHLPSSKPAQLVPFSPPLRPRGGGYPIQALSDAGFLMLNGLPNG